MLQIPLWSIGKFTIMIRIHILPRPYGVISTLLFELPSVLRKFVPVFEILSG